MARRIEIFSAGCPVCVAGEARVREVAGDHQEVVVHDLRSNEEAAARAAEQGIGAVPAVVVDGRLLGCCSNAGPDRAELLAAGVGRPHG
jgi:predicted DsbA family dithiol-disulfide isomerase